MVISQQALAEVRCNLAPTAKITGITDNGTYRSGVTVQLSGATSTPNNCSGSITQYRWRVYIPGIGWSTLYTGPSSTYMYTFETSPTVYQGSVKVELQVRNNASPNKYDIEEFDITVTRPQRVYHLKDHLGNVRTSVDTDGDVVGYDDYYPFGLPMPGRSSNTGSNPNDDYKFTGYELDEVAGTDLKMYHANARGYDPILGRFGQIDPLSDQFPALSPYHYTHNNPLNMIDPTGMFSTLVEENEDGTYSVIEGGDPNDGDNGIYVGSLDGERIGESVTSHSFYDDNGNAVEGAVIDLNSTEGQDFLDTKILDENLSLDEYMLKARSGKELDFKDEGLSDRDPGSSRLQHRTRGSVLKGGKIASARDVGNMAAGFVARSRGLSWGVARLGFDGYERLSKFTFKPESVTTQKAQRVGWGSKKAVEIANRNLKNIKTIKQYRH